MKFSLGDQRAFARLSGDFNPIHTDPAAARLTAVGEPIVHGIHALLRTLDLYFSRTPPPSTITARFDRPIVVGDTVQAERTGANSIALTLDGSLSLATISVERLPFSRDDVQGMEASRGSKRSSVRPQVRTLADIADAHGVMVVNQSNAIARMFPRASRAFGVESIRALAAISRLVGMECPGRDSLLSALSLRVDRSNSRNHLHWRVARVDPRFGLVRIEVDGGGVSGAVDAFLRPSPVSLPSWASVAEVVNAKEFAGQRALVVGGSRGLGAATAQLIAAGGGAALATFAAGKLEASTLRRTAARAGFKLDAVRFDVTQDPAKLLTRVCKRFRPTHLYYFATPRIFGRRRDPFDAERFRVFADFYVNRFAAICRAAMDAVPTLDVFYPSTTGLGADAVRELIEYTAAKAAGEALCTSLNASIPGLRVAVRRLPRVATDQTATILPIAAANPIQTMVPILRELHRRGEAGR
jgi:acyl dehydratase/NAD(P)-dependent dehydrogenase (short-subunit alcohol dehydrogenase family)